MCVCVCVCVFVCLCVFCVCVFYLIFFLFLWFLAPPGMVTSLTKSRVMGGVAGSLALGTAETIISGLLGSLDGTCLQTACFQSKGHMT